MTIEGEAPARKHNPSSFWHNPKYLVLRAALWGSVVTGSAVTGAWGIEMIDPPPVTENSQKYDELRNRVSETWQSYSNSKDPTTRAVLREQARLIEEEKSDTAKAIQQEQGLSGSLRPIVSALSVLGLIIAFNFRRQIIQGERYLNNHKLEPVTS